MGRSASTGVAYLCEGTAKVRKGCADPEEVPEVSHRPTGRWLPDAGCQVPRATLMPCQPPPPATRPGQGPRCPDPRPAGRLHLLRAPAAFGRRLGGLCFGPGLRAVYLDPFGFALREGRGVRPRPLDLELVGACCSVTSRTNSASESREACKPHSWRSAHLAEQASIRGTTRSATLGDVFVASAWHRGQRLLDRALQATSLRPSLTASAHRLDAITITLGILPPASWQCSAAG